MSREQKSLITSVCLHLALGALLWFSLIEYPDPPPVVEGVEVNFGTGPDGMGEIQPDPNQEIGTENELPGQTQPFSSESSEPETLSEEQEDAPSVAQTDKTNTPATNPKTEPTKVEKPEPNPVDAKALYPGKKGGGSSGEGETRKPGDQGDPNGSLYTKNREGGGSGNGNSSGSSGAQTGGVIHTLTGRKMTKAPSVRYAKQVAGKVVVEVWVDRSGRVIRAIPGARGTTLLDQDIWDEVKSGILSARFNTVTDGEDEQKGTISITFVLQ